MKTPHSFHIPVMGTGFTIDTPLKVARYGISSVISLVDDRLVEKIRRYYSRLYGEECLLIEDQEPDARARRITAYLDFVDRHVQRQVEDLKQSAFEEASPITNYFELVDNRCFEARQYRQMLAEADPEKKALLQAELRKLVTAGSIDVNIMTKLDRACFKEDQVQPREYSDAMAALRGFAQSKLCSRVILSAGLNLHLYSYLENFEDFYPDTAGFIKKRVVLKVSDFRSAMAQGKALAKRGIWVSEFRIESGLNCGGHAFATEGHLAGPVLEEFKEKRAELVSTLFGFYTSALKAKKDFFISTPPATHLTFQGGIGTGAENQFLLRYFKLDGTGWGTPFLLVPEATSVDDQTLEKLAKADMKEVYLSHSSPLGVPYYNLRNSASEQERRRRIELGRPGSPCTNKSAALNTEFPGSPICVSSYEYQKKKIAQLKEKNLSADEFSKAYDALTEKSCICRDLGDGALVKYGIADKARKLFPAVCPGPGIAFFSKIASLKEMVDHIYGKKSVEGSDPARPHVFINELKLYAGYLKEAVGRALPLVTKKEAEYFGEFKKNVLAGIEYYKKLAADLVEESVASRKKFLQELLAVKEELEQFVLSHAPAFAMA
jgi:hypothetical protein